MAILLPNSLADIRTKIRRMTGRLSQSQITDAQIDQYINTFYIYDFPEHLRLESLRVNYQFLTQANVPVYDFPKELYLTVMPPVFIAGYQSYMTQSRQNFFRINPQLNFLQQQVAEGNGTSGPYNFFLNINNNQPNNSTNTAILQGFKPNPPGAFTGALNDIDPRFINWNVLITAQTAPGLDGTANFATLVDDGVGNLVSIFDTGPSNGFNYTIYGEINYVTGAVTVTNFVDSVLADVNIPQGNTINAQYCPYVASRPQSVCFYQDQLYMYPIPDQPYTVSFEAYKYPTGFNSDTPAQTPQLNEWWQLLAYGAAEKIFTDNADFENAAKFRVLMDEQMRLVQRRTIVQQTSERTASIYSEQSGFFQYPFGNLFSGF